MSPQPARVDPPIRVLVADDDLSILETLTEALSSDPGFVVVGSATRAGEAVQAAIRKHPDVAVIDARMPGGGGARAIEEIRETCPGTRVVALSAYRDRETVLAMLRAGATSYMVKGLEVDELYEAIRSTANGMSVIASEVAPGIVEDLPPRPYRTRSRSSDPILERGRIRQVLQASAFTMVFQPIVDLFTEAPVGFEALARFVVEPVRGPDAWFSEAHAVGLGINLEIACIRAALRRLEVLPPSCFLSVNVSPLALASTQLLSVLDGVPGERVVLEVTEHAAVEDYDELNRALERLRLDGLRLAIDDVGAGFSSLRHLLRLKPDFIKIDRSLCLHVTSGPGRALLQGLVSFAAELGAPVIAEGIETRDELKGLREAGMELGQGFFFGFPGPIPRPPRRRAPGVKRS